MGIHSWLGQMRHWIIMDFKQEVASNIIDNNERYISTSETPLHSSYLWLFAPFAQCDLSIDFEPSEHSDIGSCFNCATEVHFLSVWIFVRSLLAWSYRLGNILERATVVNQSYLIKRMSLVNAKEIGMGIWPRRFLHTTSLSLFFCTQACTSNVFMKEVDVELLTAPESTPLT